MENLNKYFSGDLDDDQNEEVTARLIQQKFDEEAREEWGDYLREKHSLTRTPEKRTIGKRRTLLRYVAGIAASVLLLIAAIYLFQQNQSPAYHKMAVKYTQSLPIMADQIAFRKGNQDVDDIRLKANEAFADQEYEKSILLWDQLNKLQPLKHFDLFYLGTSYLLQDLPAPKKAIQNLKLATTKSKELQHEINWVLALAYLHDHQLELAKDMLEKIISNQQFMVPEASALLEVLPK